MSDNEKGVALQDNLIDEYGYMQEQPADFVGGIPERLNLSSIFIIVTELCERFAYYGVSMMFTQYLRSNLDLSKQSSVAINRGFTFFSYFTTLFGAFIADQYTGKFKAIAAFAAWYVIGMFLLAVSALSSLARSTQIALFIVSTYLFVGFGTGGIKSNVSSFVAEQIRIGYKATSTPGIYIDSRATVERSYRYFYMAINIGATSGMLICPAVAKSSGYFYAFLIPAILMVVGIIVFIPGNKRYVHKPITGSPFIKTYNCIRYALKNKSSTNEHWLDASKGIKGGEWDDNFVEGLKRSVKACKVFLFYPFYWALYNSTSDNFVNQGLQMRRPSWLSASQLNIVSSVFNIMLIPILDTFLFPYLARKGIKMGPIKRISIGFFIVSISFVYITVLQKIVYKTGPYYDFTGPNVPSDAYNDISIWWQIPAFISISVSEIHSSITGLEFAFSQSPSELKSTLTAVYLFTNAGGSLLGLILAIFSGDPTVLYLFAAESVIIFIMAIVFYSLFKHYDNYIREQVTYEG
ncbi:putative peptide transporter ptr2 [Smittium culicis]|uniref:Putative peptide transporter ptr2 n=1 Tax=Smittium culicis TaxID=133412 RepID=A0A1R1XWV3_9FUNG|nr:putative peptide transporter ptr2 [Smittium culicis]